jgi:DNA-binding NtrC family response regulator
MISGHQDMQATIEAMRAGAFDYIRKPLDLDQILGTLAKAEESITAKPPRSVESELKGMSPRPREIVGRSPVILDLLKQIAVFSQSRVTVLIQGETGTGKELVARALHEASRPAGPFVAVNCGASFPRSWNRALPDMRRVLHRNSRESAAGTGGRGDVFFTESGSPARPAGEASPRHSRRVRGRGWDPVHRLRARVMAATHRDLDARVQTEHFARTSSSVS